jgi:hypothetical protein
MIAVLVRDQDRGECFRSDTGGGQALESFLAREARIDEQTRALRGNQSGVAGAGRRKYRELDYDGASSLLDAESVGGRKHALAALRVQRA